MKTIKNTKAQAQRDTLINHLRSGRSITIREAFKLYGVQSLTKRLSEIRAEGYEIVNGKTLEDGLDVGVWIMRFDPYKNQKAPFVKGDKVRLKADIYYSLREGMIGEVLFSDRRDNTSFVDIAGRRVWVNNQVIERFVPLEVGTRVTISGPAWIVGYNIGSNTYTIQTPTHEITVPAPQVQVDIPNDCQTEE